jgi:inner membrane protein
MIWWWWILLGFVLLLLELMTPGGFYVLFFGLSALIVGVMVKFGIGGAPWVQWLVFTVLSLIGLGLFRRPLLDKFREPEDRKVDQLVGETAVAMDDIPAGGLGKAEMRGTSWTARNNGTVPLMKGDRATVERIEGLTLHLSGKTL